MLRRFAPVFLVAALVLAWLPAWAQTAPPAPAPAEMSWLSILALAINTVGTLVVLKLAATVVPALRDRFPDVVPFLSVLVGPGVAWVQKQLAAVGILVDLSPLLAIFSGGSAMAITMFTLQRRRRMAARVTGGVVPMKLSRDLGPI